MNDLIPPLSIIVRILGVSLSELPVITLHHSTKIRKSNSKPRTFLRITNPLNEHHHLFLRIIIVVVPSTK